ncbi:AraC family transcriptional regulator [Asticcacaulis sp. EMRT-3]|uniref:AraC family transcriptional regulator n=1 Tax=Asticcacaulis sp. EMRT-3 TaxID=3040349 RepID=UPI0024AE99A9|nr:AraC family transcriptional regulator [Asticcacaulis sp. EMRT-3]MDI7776667.1 AraC family transcriptional regulator [Asticcacaulis sp. EMRT-3]
MSECQGQASAQHFLKGETFDSLRAFFIERKLASHMNPDVDKGQFNWKLNFLGLGRNAASLAPEMYFYRIICDGAWTRVDHPDRSIINMVMPLRGRVSLIRGDEYIEAEPGLALLYQSDGHSRRRHEPDATCHESVGFTMDFRNAERVLSDILQFPVESDLKLSPRLELDTTHGRIVASMIEQLSTLPHTDSHPPLTPRLQQRLVEAFTHLVLECSLHRYSERMVQSGGGAVPGYIRRARDFMRQHYHEPLTIADIADEVQVSLRTLEIGFRTFLDTTPLIYLRTLRLRRARELLISPDNHRPISAIARDLGFYHIGRFAQYYARLFGESPSETRRHRTTPQHFETPDHEAGA